MARLKAKDLDVEKKLNKKDLQKVRGGGIVINTNVSSLKAQKNLDRAQKTLSKSFARLSSGLRINSASDDAAGLGVAENKEKGKRFRG